MSVEQFSITPFAAGYELIFCDGPYTEALLPAMAGIKQTMNDAPTEDLDVEDMQWTPELLRQIDETMIQRGLGRWTLLARENSTGDLAGYSEILWQPAKPEIAMQGDTAVLAAYRNLGLGRWLKAAMLNRIMAERPEVKSVRTHNAGSNAPMLKINEELGFRPYYASSIWQVETERVLQRLGQ